MAWFVMTDDHDDSEILMKNEKKNATNNNNKFVICERQKVEVILSHIYLCPKLAMWRWLYAAYVIEAAHRIVQFIARMDVISAPMLSSLTFMKIEFFFAVILSWIRWGYNAYMIWDCEMKAATYAHLRRTELRSNFIHTLIFCIFHSLLAVFYAERCSRFAYVHHRFARCCRSVSGNAWTRWHHFDNKNIT